MKVEIRHRWNLNVIFSAEIPDDTPEQFRIRAAVELAVSQRANLRATNLSDANLRAANLRAANLSATNLSDANLSGANLSDADLRAADLSAANLRGADLSDADLSATNLSDANLRAADLSAANLSGANLSAADLRDADLSDANLRAADLSGANLRDADLTGANFDIRPATPEQAIENLDKVREIILDNADRLHMNHWHGDEQWKERTCAEETLCGTTHCLAGWLQVCATDERLRKLDSAMLAGSLAAPVARSMFFRSDAETVRWLREREYAK